MTNYIESDTNAGDHDTDDDNYTDDEL